MFGSKAKEVRKPRPGVVMGPDDMDCPFHQRPMSEVCHSCPMWQMLRGVHPQTGEPIPDEWNCALAHQTKLYLEATQQMRQAGASADKVATEVKKFHDSMVAMNHIAAAISKGDVKLIEQ